MTKSDITKKIESAYEGRRIWIDIMDKYSLSEKDYAILIPSCESECNYYTCLYLDEFLSQKKSDKAVVLTHDETVLKNLNSFSSKAKAVNFPREKAEHLMQFYCLYQFTDKLIIASLDEPNGRNARALLGKNDIDMSKIVAYGIYGMNEIKTQQFGRDLFE